MINKVELQGTIKKTAELSEYGGKTKAQAMLSFYPYEKATKPQIVAITAYGAQITKLEALNEGDEIEIAGQLSVSNYKDAKTDQWKTFVSIAIEEIY